MEIYKVSPRGYCSGVVNALKVVKETIANYPDSKIYMLGLFVHNPAMIEEFGNKINILDDTNISRYDLVNGLPYASHNEIIILSAHGTDLKTIHLAIKKGYKVINTTCKYVYDTHDAINLSLSNNHNVIFIGKTNHPETNAILAINDDIIFIDYQSPNFEIDFDQEIMTDVYNQTTLSIFDIQKHHDFLINNFKNIKIYNDICDATTLRQKALMDFDVEVDVFFVIGYSKSSNSNELLKIAKKKFKHAYLINSIDEIDLNLLRQSHKIGITSGTSTPTKLTNEIIEFLKEF